MTRPQVLVVTHKSDTDPGHIGRWLRARGFRLDVRTPRFGDSLPANMDDHAGAVIFGGPMSVNDADEYIKQEIDWIGVPLAEGKPFLGVCLGAQMLAKFLGAEVKRHPCGLAEIGYHPLHASPEANGAALPQQVYQWHSEGFALPAGAKALAHGEVFENQAFQFGPSAFGVQFHPEMTLAMIHRWTTRSLDRYSGPAVQPRDEQIGRHLCYGPAKQRWLSEFLENWLGLDAQQPCCGRRSASLPAQLDEKARA